MSHLDTGLALLDIRYMVLCRDVIFIALLSYLLVSPLAYAVESFVRYRHDRRVSG